jgi:hypothetical protein
MVKHTCHAKENYQHLTAQGTQGKVVGCMENFYISTGSRGNPHHRIGSATALLPFVASLDEGDSASRLLLGPPCHAVMVSPALAMRPWQLAIT